MLGGGDCLSKVHRNLGHPFILTPTSLPSPVLVESGDTKVTRQ